MRAVTLCEPTGKMYKPREKDEYPCEIYRLKPGTAWLMDDDKVEHKVVPVTEKIAKEAEYLFLIRHHDGRSMMEFKHGDKIYAQPEKEDRRATEGGARHKRGQSLDQPVRSGGVVRHQHVAVEGGGGRHRGRAQQAPELQEAAAVDRGGDAGVGERPARTRRTRSVRTPELLL